MEENEYIKILIQEYKDLLTIRGKYLELKELIFYDDKKIDYIPYCKEEMMKNVEEKGIEDEK